MLSLFIIIALLLTITYLLVNFEKYKRATEIKHISDLSSARADALKKSRSTINGYVTETLAPIIPGFPYNGRDATHVGSPLDFVIFDGMSEYRDNGVGEIKIILCDIKTGSAQLTPVEKAIKEACEAKRIEWVTLRMDLDKGGLSVVKHRKKTAEPTIREQDFSDRLDILENHVDKGE